VTVFARRASLGVVGHRGGRGPDWPTENTMAAFERAVREGADAIELDVRQCATGEVVVFHDPDLKRMSNGADLREVRNVSYVELATRHRAPLLRDVLAFCIDRRIGVNVEVKYDLVDRARLVRAVLRQLDAFPSADVIVSSFDPRILARFRVLRPRVLTALLTTTERKWSLPLARFGMRPPMVHAIHLEQKQATPRVVRALKKRGLYVGVWTVNDPRDATTLRALGVDWVITDAPGRIDRVD
jgi:glycerophosphoryl diester phosphodiesterase